MLKSLDGTCSYNYFMPGIRKINGNISEYTRLLIFGIQSSTVYPDNSNRKFSYAYNIRKKLILLKRLC